MNIDIDTEQFAVEFQQATAFASARSPREVLQNIHIVVNPDGMFLNATDGFHSVRIKSSALTETHDTGQLLIPIERGGKMFRELTGNANIVVGEKSAKVDGDGCSFSFPTANPDEFPSVETKEPRSHVEIPAGVLSRMIKETVYACDDGDSRYALGGVSFEHDGEKLLMVATDGRRMSKSEYHCQGKDDSLSNGTTIVPSRSLQSIARLLAKSESIARLAAPLNTITIDCGPIMVSVRLIDGRFPNWRQIEANRINGHQATINIGELHRSVRRAAVVTDIDSRGIDFEFSSDGLTVMGQGESSGESNANTNLLWNSETIVVTLDNAFVSDFCRSVDPESEVTIEVASGKAPVYLSNDEGLLHMIQCMARNR
jgi:DNA polymerase-3 subunit beta